MLRRVAASLHHNLSLLTIGNGPTSLLARSTKPQALRFTSSEATTEDASDEKFDAGRKSSHGTEQKHLADRPRHAYSREVLEKMKLAHTVASRTFMRPQQDPGSRKILPYSSLKFDAYPYYIERNWAKEGKRLTFWATFRMLRDYKARKICRENAPERLRYKVMRTNTILPQVIMDEFAERMLKMPKYAHPKNINAMCTFTGRTRGKIKRFRVNRHIFRRLSDHGMLSGVQRALWSAGRNMNR